MFTTVISYRLSDIRWIELLRNGWGLIVDCSFERARWLLWLA